MLKSDILEFLKSKENTLLLKCCPAEMLEALAELDVYITDDMDMNGWEYDWRCTGKYKKQKLSFSGSAWYGSGKIEKVNE